MEMEANLLLISLVTYQILMAMRDMVLEMAPSGSHERSMNLNVQLNSSPERMFMVLAFC
jgi:hypothetical protein